MSTYTNAHARVKKWMFEGQFPGNWFELGTILMIFDTLESELFRFKFHWLGSIILKSPEFNLQIENNLVIEAMRSSKRCIITATT